MTHELSLRETQKEWHGTLRAYVIGFFASLLLTCISFALVHFQLMERKSLAIIIVTLALTQAVVQLLFFLHLGQEEKPKWETLIFIFMVVILLIVALGSLWIMFDLDARMMMEMHHD